jgi:hypothetical protein
MGKSIPDLSSVTTVGLDLAKHVDNLPAHKSSAAE